MTASQPITPQPTGVVTPEAVVLEFESAGAGSRALAKAIDLVVQGVALFVLILGVGFAAGFGGFAESWMLVAFLIVVFALIIIGYPIAMESLWNGRTLGKAAMGLRVVGVEGAPVRFRQSFIRGILAIVEVYLTAGAVAMFAILFSQRDQRLGDMVGGTIVVRERHGGARSLAMSFPPPMGYEAYVHSLDVSSVSEEQYQLIRTLLLRLWDLSPEARSSLVLRLANPLAVQMRHTPPPMVGPELFLICVAAAYQRRHVGAAGGSADFNGAPGGPGTPGVAGPGVGPSDLSAYPGGLYPGNPGAGYPGGPGYPGYPGSGYAGGTGGPLSPG